MPTFSERRGYKAIKGIQRESMDVELRTSLWNVFYEVFLQSLDENEETIYASTFTTTFFKKLWTEYFKNPLDEFDEFAEESDYNLIRDYFQYRPWFEVIDFLEFVSENGRNNGIIFAQKCNRILEREVSAYRIVGKTITEITSVEEIQEIEEGLSSSIAHVREHIETSLKLFSDRVNPDYRNSVKESISAVESICRIITGEKSATLGQALRRLSEKGINFHGALERGFSSLYGYASDAEGIRHALMEESTLSFEDAKFFLVACSAFCNYLTVKANKAKII